jgi:predicted MFS family arabinose efflux permease
MLDGWGPGWRGYVRPLAVATGFTVAGEAMVFVYWGLILHPGGDVVDKLIWTTTCAIGMGGTTGLMAGFIVGERYEGTVAAIISALCYVIVLAAGILVSYKIDTALDLFGVTHDPQLFILTGVVPTLLTAPLYGWLLHGNAGRALLSRIGL